MKQLFYITLFVTINFFTLAQNGVYIKYELTINGEGDEVAMMKKMMDGSEMVIATNEDHSYVSTSMGAMGTTSVEMRHSDSLMTMYMSGMMGRMAYRGHAGELEDGSEETSDINLKLVDAKKTILGYTCKKATTEDAEGNISTFWYTEEVDRPYGVSQLPDQVPGLALEFNIANPMINMTYTAKELSKDIDISKYKVVVPEDVEIKSFEELNAMGQGQ